MLFFAVLLFHNLKMLNRFIEIMLLMFLLTTFSEFAKSEYIVLLNIECKKRFLKVSHLPFCRKAVQMSGYLMTLR